jgi:hypothetical protein
MPRFRPWGPERTPQNALCGTLLRVRAPLWLVASKPESTTRDCMFKTESSSGPAALYRISE